MKFHLIDQSVCCCRSS